MDMARFSLRSPLSRDEVVQRLRDNIDRGFNLFGSNAIIGWVDRHSFNLRVRINYRNSFQTILRGRMTDADGGTKISCRAGMPVFTIMFTTVWFSLFAFFFMMTLPQLSFRDPSDFIGILVPALGAGLILVGRWIARHELGTLTAFLEDVIDAERAT
jgi:hypothetical protein